jgi:hypothetical protein
MDRLTTNATSPKSMPDTQADPYQQYLRVVTAVANLYGKGLEILEQYSEFTFNMLSWD